MYTRYYGLAQKPFELFPDPEMVFMSEGHKEALAILTYGVQEGKGFILLTGAAGTGKTTMLEALLKSVHEQVLVCVIANPILTLHEFYCYLAHGFGLPEFSGNKSHFLFALTELLQRSKEEKKKVLLIIDEAHALPPALFDEVRLLSNQGAGNYGMLSIFLVGQPELNKILSQDALLPLRQRISIRFHLKRFSPDETDEYIKFRLLKAGSGRLDLFSDAAVKLIYKASNGLPRLINSLCDQALISGFVAEKRRIEPEIIKECIRELQLPGSDEEDVDREPGLLLWLFQSLSRKMMIRLFLLGIISVSAWLIIQRPSWAAITLERITHSIKALWP